MDGNAVEKSQARTPENVIDRIFKITTNIVLDVLSLLALALLICATGLLAYELFDALTNWEAGKLRHVAINIFTVLVFMEVTQLFRNFKHGTGFILREVIEMSFLLVMREFIVKSIESTGSAMDMFGYAAVLATLSIAWWVLRGHHSTRTT